MLHTVLEQAMAGTVLELASNKVVGQYMSACASSDARAGDVTVTWAP